MGGGGGFISFSFKFYIVKLNLCIQGLNAFMSSLFARSVKYLFYVNTFFEILI